MKEYIFFVGNVGIPYTISESNKAKNIKFSIGLDGLKVTKPKKTNINEVKRALEAKSKWIYKHYIDVCANKEAIGKREWESGESVLYIGENYNIKIFQHKNKRTYICFNGEQFEVFENENVVNDDRKLLIENAFKKWYIMTANEVISERLDYFCKVIGLTYNKIRIKEQKTRWGSCSSNGNLNFNWRLIMSPQWVIDYVIVHELCHLKYLNHSKDYWNLVGMYMPNYKEAQQWLKKNGIKLVL